MVFLQGFIHRADPGLTGRGMQTESLGHRQRERLDVEGLRHQQREEQHPPTNTWEQHRSPRHHRFGSFV